MSEGLSDGAIRLISAVSGVVIAAVFGWFGYDLGASIPVSVVGGGAFGIGAYLSIGAVLRAEQQDGSLGATTSVLGVGLNPLAAGSALTFAGAVVLIAGAIVVPGSPALGLVAAVAIGAFEYAVLSRLLVATT